MSRSDEQAQRLAVPAPFFAVPNPLAKSGNRVSDTPQIYTENAKESSVSHDSSFHAMLRSVHAMMRLDASITTHRLHSGSALQMLQEIETMKQHLETYLAEFLASHDAPVSLTLNELSTYLRAEGYCYDERGEYVGQEA